MSLHKLLTINTAVYTSLCQDSQPIGCNKNSCKLLVAHHNTARRCRPLSLYMLRKVLYMFMLLLNRRASLHGTQPGLGPQRHSVVFVMNMHLYREAPIRFCCMLGAALRIAILVTSVQP